MEKQHTYTVFDIETTGLSAACLCEIIEFVGFTLDQDLNVIDQMHIFIKPYAPIPPKITALTGISNAAVANCENRYTALPKIRNFIGDSYSVCHNSVFDVGFINIMCVQQSLPVLSKSICTMRSYKAITKARAGKLCDACSKYGISLVNAHTAEADAFATVQLFQRLMEDDPKKIVKKELSRREATIQALKAIASENPNKKIREALCNCNVPTCTDQKFDEETITTVESMFAQRKDPVTVAASLNLNSNDVADLFLIWLDKSKLPGFVFLEEQTQNTQVKTMISLCGTLQELYDLHGEIYGEAINKGIYHYYWRKYVGNIDERLEMKIVGNYLLKNGCPLTTIVQSFTGIGISRLIETFCAFAQKYKDQYRSYIVSSICNREKLAQAKRDNLTVNAKSIRLDPDRIGYAVTLKLLERGFFNL